MYMYVTNLEEGPPFGGDDRSHILVQLAPILNVLNMLETSMFLCRGSLRLVCKLGTHTRRENHKWYVSFGRR